MTVLLMSGRRIRPNGSFVYVRKCKTDHIRDENGKILLYRTEKDVETSNIAEIIAIGPDCKEFSRDDVGRAVEIPDGLSGVYRLGDMSVTVNGEVVPNEDFAVRESALFEVCPYTFPMEN
jgi:hypothetical protein